MKDIIEGDLRESAEVKVNCIEQSGDKIELLVEKIIETYKNGGKVLIFGNGGSAADAQHVAGELVGHYNLDRRSYPAIALTTDSSIITCVSNDYAFDRIFSRQVEGLGQPGDLAIGITTSGNSTNVVKGLEKARRQDLYTVGFTGNSGGEMREMVDVLINVPSESTPRVQEAHITIFHIVCDLVERKLEGEL
ncbi:MAG: D-sedoheptulose 7-phosphate isomerase [Bacillota bacterium]